MDPSASVLPLASGRHLLGPVRRSHGDHEYSQGGDAFLYNVIAKTVWGAMIACELALFVLLASCLALIVADVITKYTRTLRINVFRSRKVCV
jgi:hypothetical protein